MNDDGPVYIDEDHQRIAEFAATYLEEEERDDFVDGMLERRGYQRVTNWAPPPPPEPPAGGGGQGGKRPVLPQKQGRKAQGGRGGNGGRQDGGGGYWGR